MAYPCANKIRMWPDDYHPCWPSMDSGGCPVNSNRSRWAGARHISIKRKPALVYRRHTRPYPSPPPCHHHALSMLGQHPVNTDTCSTLSSRGSPLSWGARQKNTRQPSISWRWNGPRHIPISNGIRQWLRNPRRRLKPDGIETAHA